MSIDPPTKPKRRHRGSEKGAGFERQISQRLSLWVSNSLKDDIFWRASGSGSRATNLMNRGRFATNQAGDICCVGSEGHELIDNVFIECKFYADWNLKAVVGKNQGFLPEFWEKAQKDAKKFSKLPMIIGKSNNWITFAAVSSDGAQVIRNASTAAGRSITELAIFPAISMHFFNFQDVLIEVPYEFMKKELLKWRSSLTPPTSTLRPTLETSIDGASSTGSLLRRRLEE